MKLKNELKGVKWLVRQPFFIVYAVGLLLITVSMAFGYRHTAYNSDDVVWQNGLLTWSPFGDNVFYGNKDVGFILQLPIYWLVSLFFEPGRHAMLVDGILLALLNFTFVYAAVLYFLKTAKVKISYFVLLPVLWLCALGSALDRIFLGTNLHTLTVGLTFISLAATAEVCRRKLLRGRDLKSIAVAILMAMFIGLCVVNDRYFVYFGIVPMLALIGLYWYNGTTSTKRAIVAAGVLAAGYATSMAMVIGLSRIGLELLHGVGEPKFVPFEQLGDYLLNTLHSVLTIMNINFFGQPVASPATLVSLVNLVLLALVIIASIRLLRSYKKHPEMAVMAGLLWFITATHAVSSFNMGVIQTFRYFVMMPFVAALVLAVALNTFASNKLRTAGLKALLIVAVLLNIGAGIFAPLPVNGYPDSQMPNILAVEDLRNAGIAKGYTEYWSSHITTYLSGGDVTVLPVLCDQGTSKPFVWFVDKDTYLKPAKSSFYMFVDGAPMCPKEYVQRQFGVPSEELHITGGTVWIYNYDLASRMDLSEFKH